MLEKVIELDVNKFVKTVENLCKSKNVTPTKACLESGLNRSFLTDIKTKSPNPRIESLGKMADYFGVTISELLGESASPVPDSGTLSPADRRLLDAYHQAAPELQAAVRRILEI